MDRTQPVRLEAALFLVSIVFLVLYISNGQLLEMLESLSSNAGIISEPVREPEALSIYIDEVGILPILMSDYSNVDLHEFRPGLVFGPQSNIYSLDQIASDLALAQANIAKALAEQDRLNEGMTWAEQALRLDPYLPQAHLALGYLNYRLRNTYQAINNFEMVLKIDSSNFEANLYLGIIYNGRGEPQEAMRYLYQAIDLSSKPEDTSRALTIRANSFAMLWRYENAFRDLDMAKELDPDNGWADIMRGSIEDAIYNRSINRPERCIITAEQLDAPSGEMLCEKVEAEGGSQQGFSFGDD